MANKELQTRIIHKHDTAANWEANASFVPKQGELIVYDADDNFTYERFKIGDGATTVANLPFMPGPADSVLVVTATPVTEEIAATDYTSQQIIEHINNGGTSMMLYNDLMLPLRIIEQENAEVGYGTTMVTEAQAEVTTMMIEVSGNTATIRRANYDPAKAGFLKDANVYDKTYIDEKVVELSEAIANNKGERYVWIGTCNTESNVANKVISTDNVDFELKDGAVIFVRFHNSTTIDIASLNVDNTGAKPAYAASSSEGSVSYVSANTIGYNEVVAFVYNGLYYTRVDGNLATTDYYGMTKLTDSVNSTSTNTAATPNSVKQAYDLASSANTAASEIGTIKTTIAGLQVELDTHEDNKANPHDVTAVQVGADPAGTAASVVAEHAENMENPHGVTKEQLGITTVSSGADGLMSAADKTKLDEMSVKLNDIENGANNYTHPTYSAKNNGLYKIMVDSTGHVSYAAKATKDDITSLGIPSQDTTYSVVSTSENGLMSSTDKTKLDELMVDFNTHINSAANPHGVTADMIGADSAGTATSTVNTHNTNTSAHNDIRILVSGLSDRLNAVANSSDEDLDTLAEIVEYIKSNKTLLDAVTTNKVNVSDIVDNLTTNVSNQPLSAAQGVAIKTITDGLESTKAPKMLIVSSDYTGENGALEVDHSSDEILTHLRAGGDTMYDDIDIGKIPYLWDLANKVYYGGTIPYGDDFMLAIYEISGTSVTSKGFLYSDFVKKTEIEGLLTEIPDTFETKEDASAKLIEAKAYTDELGQGFGQVLELMYGEDAPEDDNFLSIRDIAHDTIQSLVVTAESTDGVAYTATVPGIASLTKGTSIIIIPNKTSTSKAPTLNVNGLGAIPVRRRMSHLVTSPQQGYNTNWLTADFPFRLIYVGSYWIVEGHNKPAAADLYGTPAAATKATQDGDGNVITDTYATKAYVEELIGAILNGAS